MLAEGGLFMQRDSIQLLRCLCAYHKVRNLLQQQILRRKPAWRYDARPEDGKKMPFSLLRLHLTPLAQMHHFWQTVAEALRDV